MMRLAAIIVAGGSGERFGSDGGKQLIPIAGRPLLSWTVLAADAVAEVGLIVVVTHPDRVAAYRAEAVDPLSLRAEVLVVGGGSRRQDSVAAGLAVVPEEFDLIAVHDGARPLLPADALRKAVSVLEHDSALDGAVIGHPATDTLKLVEGRLIEGTADRSRFWQVQTPQVFRVDVLRRAYGHAETYAREATDDAGLVEQAGGTIAVVEGPRDNMKVTLAEDAAIVEAILRFRQDGQGS